MVSVIKIVFHRHTQIKLNAFIDLNEKKPLTCYGHYKHVNVLYFKAKCSVVLKFIQNSSESLKQK